MFSFSYRYRTFGYALTARATPYSHQPEALCVRILARKDRTGLVEPERHGDTVLHVARHRLPLSITYLLTTIEYVGGIVSW